MTITGCNFCVRVTTSEFAALNTTLLYCCNEKQAVVKSRVAQISVSYVQWAYSDSAEVPSFAKESDLISAQSRCPFWKLINDYVMTNGPVHPVRFFRHALLFFFSRMKGGVGFAAQFRSELNCSGVSVGC